MNRNEPSLSSRRDGDPTHCRALAAVAAALLLLAPAAGAQRTGDTATPQRQQQDQNHNTQQKEAHSNELERKALSAYEARDSGPVENWFGCPPKRDPNATRAPDSEVRSGRTGETASGDDACDPDAPANDSPQKEDSNY